MSENVVDTAWCRDNYFRAIGLLVGKPARLGIEAEHLTLARGDRLNEYFGQV